MAAGRHNRYRDHEFRARESDIAVSRKKEFYRDPYRDGDRERGGADRGSGDKVRVRNRDINERGVLNGTRRSYSGTSNSSGGEGNDGRWSRGQFSATAVDRESGELSSGSGTETDDQDAPQSKVRTNGVKMLENGVSSPQTLKRKFSPIVWDRSDGKESNVVPSGSKVDSVSNGTLPPAPPLPVGFVPSISTNMARSFEHSSPLDNEETTYPNQHHSSDQEIEQVEEEYILERNISASRWADWNNAPEDDEAENFSDVSGIKRRKSKPVLNLSAGVVCKKTPSPELGEVIMREGSEGAASRRSDSGGENIDYLQESEIGKSDNMNVDGQDADADAIDRLSDSGNDVEDDIVDTPESVQPPQRSISMLQGCRSVDEFERLNKINEGTYGVVYRAKDKKTGEIVALKKVKMEKEREGFPLTALREINILLSFHHPYIVDVKEVVVGSSLDSIFMVMEYMEHDLKVLMETMKQPFSQSEVKCLMLQLLEGVKYLHDNWVLHRDLKTSNILLNNRGELKICDFGMSRQYGSPLKPYTHLVVTLWYRAPELLLGTKEYSTAIDMWSLGCIMAEILAKEPLFNGQTEFGQLDKIFRILGTPNEKIWPGFAKLPGVKVNFAKQPYNKLREKFPPTSFTGRPTLSEKGFDLLNKLLTYDPEKRITAEAALQHEWFTEVPLPKSKDFMPTFPAQHARDRHLRRNVRSPDPLEEQWLKELHQKEVGAGGLFG